MTDRFATSPFGARPLSAAVFQAAEKARKTQKTMARNGAGQGGNQTAKADKWQLLRALTEAKASFGISDRAIAVLEALCSFQPGHELDGSAPLIVFPSNKELSLRLRGMAPSTIRRHIAALVDAGLVLRKDSANGKRYCRRNPASDEPDMAFGFDLSPFVLAAPEIHDAADRARQAHFEREKLRTSITIHLRDCRKIINSAITEDLAGDWRGHEAALDALSGRVSRYAPAGELEARLRALSMLRDTVERDYLSALDLCDKSQNMSGNDAQIERHIHNSNTNQNIDILNDTKRKPDQTGGAPLDEMRGLQQAKAPETKSMEGLEPGHSESGAGGFAGFAAPVAKLPSDDDLPPLSMVLQGCPDMINYARNGISSWAELEQTASLVRTMLGVSPSAWSDAQLAMGTRAAAIMMACMLERAEDIKSPGGYVRALADRAEQGKFSVWPMVRAQVNR